MPYEQFDINVYRKIETTMNRINYLRCLGNENPKLAIPVSDIGHMARIVRGNTPESLEKLFGVGGTCNSETPKEPQIDNKLTNEELIAVHELIDDLKQVGYWLDELEHIDHTPVEIDSVFEKITGMINRNELR